MQQEHSDHAGPTTAIMTHWREVTVEVAVIVVAYFAYFLVRGVTEGSPEQAWINADRIVRLEETLGIAWESTMQGWIADVHALVTLANWVYIYGHWPAIALIAGWLLLRHPGRYRVVRNAFLLSGAIGLVIFASFPVAPPRFTDATSIDTITEFSRSYRVFQPPALTNQYAAMPSLHFGWNLVIGIMLFRTATFAPARLFGVLLPVFMFLAVIVTANHFILDAVAGGGLALAALWLVDPPDNHAGASRVRRLVVVAKRSGFAARSAPTCL